MSFLPPSTEPYAIPGWPEQASLGVVQADQGPRNTVLVEYHPERATGRTVPHPHRTAVKDVLEEGLVSSGDLLQGGKRSNLRMNEKGIRRQPRPCPLPCLPLKLSLPLPGGRPVRNVPVPPPRKPEPPQPLRRSESANYESHLLELGRIIPDVRTSSLPSAGTQAEMRQSVPHRCSPRPPTRAGRTAKSKRQRAQSLGRRPVDSE